MSDQLTLISFQELAALQSPLNAQDSAQSASVKRNRSAKKFSHNTGPQSQSILTSANSTAKNTEASRCSQVDFLANHLAKPGSSEARKMTATSGQKCARLLRTQSPIGSLVRTLMGSTVWGSTIVFLTWKPSATKSRRRLKFRLVPRMPRIDETEFGLLPTATKSGAKSKRPTTNGQNISLTTGARYGLNQIQAVKLLPTPTVNGNHNRKGASATSGDGITTALKRQAGLLPTPRESGGSHGICWKRAENGNHYSNLEDVLGAEFIADGNPRQTGLNVNPDWQDWFMGYPIKHTALKPQETPLSRKSRSKSSKASTKKSSKPADPNKPF